MSYENHRLLENLSKAITKGNRLFFLYSNGVNDNMFLNFYNGVLNVSDNLKYYFLNEENVDWFITLNSENQFNFFDKNGLKTKNDFLDPPKKTGFNFDGNTTNLNKDDKAKTEAIDSNLNATDTDTILKQINDKMLKDNEKIALYFDGFEWIASLYSSDDSKKLPFVKYLKKFINIRNSFLVVSLKNIELLKSFDFDVDLKQSNVLYLGNPNKEEITNAYTRYLFRNHKNCEFTSKDMDDISSAIRGSDRTLKEAMNILKAVLKLNPKKLTIDLFKDALDKSIEEKIEWDDVILDKDIKDDIEQKVKDALNNPKEAKKGISLYGPPGVGKTYLAKALANKFNCYFMAPSLADLKGRFVGESAKNVQEVFKKARSNSPTILFLDEIDTIFPSRSLGAGESDSFGKDMVNQFLVEIDGFSSGEQKIFIIGATNRIQHIDSAIISRLPDKKIPLPTKNELKQLFDLKLKPFKFSKQLWHDKYLEKSLGLSGRDIDNFCKDGFKMIYNKEFINEDNFKTAFGIYEKKLLENIKQELKGITVIKNSENGKSYKNFTGNNTIKNKIAKIIDVSKKRYKEFGAFETESIFIYGETGCGKSLLVESVAGENNFHFIKIAGKDIVDDYVKKLDTLKTEVIKIAKIGEEAKGVVLFFDDLDSVAGSNGNILFKTTLSETLKEIKESSDNIILFGATNSISEIDEMIIDIFDEQFKLSNPSRNDAIEIMKMQLSKYSVSQDDLYKLYEYVLEEWKKLEKERLFVYFEQNIYLSSDDVETKVDKKLGKITLSNKDILNTCKKIIKKAEANKLKENIIEKFINGEI